MVTPRFYVVVEVYTETPQEARSTIQNGIYRYWGVGECGDEPYIVDVFPYPWSPLRCMFRLTINAMVRLFNRIKRR